MSQVKGELGCVGCSVRMSFCCLAADKRTECFFFKLEFINGTPASSFDCLTLRMIEHKLKESGRSEKTDCRYCRGLTDSNP